MQVIIESREPVFSLPTEDAPDGVFLYHFVRATVQDETNTRSGPYYVELPQGATDADLQQHIAGLFGG
jgi:hypothetical protein